MLRIERLSKSYGTQVLFENVQLQLNRGERLGLIGRNGHGKTTLFKIVLGEEEADAGRIMLPDRYRLGYLSQHLCFTQATVLEEACQGLPEAEKDQEYQAKKILSGLGFDEADLQRSPAKFSGGFQLRLHLAKVLLSRPNLLLLDEPTNYLDILALRWLTAFLAAWPGELVVISHDRDFMNRVTTHTAAIHRRKLRKIEGSAQKLEAQLRQEEELYERTRLHEEAERQKTEAFIERFRAKANKASLVQSRVKRLEKNLRLEQLESLARLDFRFRELPFPAQTCMELQELSFGFGGVSLIDRLSLAVKKSDRIAVVGKNGRGKSTLLRLMAGELQPSSGSIRRHERLVAGCFGQTHIQRLGLHQSVEAEILASNPQLGRTEVRAICAAMLFEGEKAEKKISVLSGGERSRVLLGKILAAPANLLLLDEPTHHLDMESVDALTESLQYFSGAVVLVTHSESLLRRWARRLIVFGSDGPSLFEGGYDEFLEKVGWKDEKQVGQIQTGKSAEKMGSLGSGCNKKDLRRKRAQKNAERAAVIKPLQKQMQALEADIMGEERELALKKKAYLEAATISQADKIRELSIAMAEAERRLNDLYEQLTVLTEAYESALHEVADE